MSLSGRTARALYLAFNKSASLTTRRTTSHHEDLNILGVRHHHHPFLVWFCFTRTPTDVRATKERVLPGPRLLFTLFLYFSRSWSTRKYLNEPHLTNLLT